MQRFYFHLRDDLDVTDLEGIEFLGIDEAHAYAVKNARAIAAEQVLSGGLRLDHRIEIADKNGAVLRTVRFGEVVAVTE